MLNFSVLFLGNFYWLDFLFAITAWLITVRHTKSVNQPVSQVVKYFQKFILFFSIFMFFMAATRVVLLINPEQFSQFMAIGYTIGSVFLFIGLSYLARLMTELLPKFNARAHLVQLIWLAFGGIITLLHIYYVIGQTPPVFDPESKIVLFPLPTILKILLSAISLGTYLPLGVVLIRSGLKVAGAARIRYFLFASALLVDMIGGPLHGAAQTQKTFFIADMFTVTFLTLLMMGIIYRTKDISNQKPLNGDKTRFLLTL